MKRSKSRVLAVIGAQYGSEAKGSIVAHIAGHYDYHVRVGAPNAGHTIYWNGKKVVMQSIPCGWVNPKAMLVIGRGALVSMEILCNEIQMLTDLLGPDIQKRIVIDAKAGVISDWHHKEEGGVLGTMHQRIGSTGEGVGAARRDRVMRDPQRFRFVDQVMPEKYRHMLYDNTARMLSMAIQDGENVLLEGAQGSGLSLIHGPWPYCTSHDTNAAQIAADCGIPPHFVTDVLLVARTHPIRVAGNSGPLNGEITWEELSEKLGRTVTEKTTVTKKTRRIGRWDEQLVSNAMMLNGASQIALNFMDYMTPDDAGVTDYNKLSVTARSFVEYVELRFGVTVPFVGTGPDTLIDRGIFRP